MTHSSELKMGSAKHNKSRDTVQLFHLSFPKCVFIKYKLIMSQLYSAYAITVIHKSAVPSRVKCCCTLFDNTYWLCLNNEDKGRRGWHLFSASRDRLRSFSFCSRRATTELHSNLLTLRPGAPGSPFSPALPGSP